MTWSRTGQNLQRLRSLGTVYLYRYENERRPHDRRVLGAIKFAIALIEEARENMSDDQAWEALVARARERDIRFPPTSTLRKKEGDSRNNGEGEDDNDEQGHQPGARDASAGEESGGEH